MTNFKPHKIEHYELRPGDTLLFYGKGPLFEFFNFLLCIFEQRWRTIPRKLRPWHMGKVWRRKESGWLVLEAWSPVSRLHYYSDVELAQTAMAVRALPFKLDAIFKDKCEREYLGRPYDVTIYFWTMLQYFIRHYLNSRIPRLLDNRFTCWELAQSVDCDADYNWGSKYDCVMITDYEPIYDYRNTETAAVCGLSLSPM